MGGFEVLMLVAVYGNLLVKDHLMFSYMDLISRAHSAYAIQLTIA